jgi:hypothetical protein
VSGKPGGKYQSTLFIVNPLFNKGCRYLPITITLLAFLPDKDFLSMLFFAFA